ncbi:MFS transporter [Actinoplanes sp. N902-109]|uniref:MFS transporter n=1 Tax=Actinoplanes sp. (strain N902-109) TaxID=649831 RepID=UPI00032952D1|nr:MFS transporter [Actinoplanes sp. N902-109]AGL19079.1 major facilitator superfamily protein [Actinoplanes sp. N902-109]
MWHLLGTDRRFRRVFAGSSLSTFGDTALYLTLPIWVKELTGSNSAAGLVFFALGLAALLEPLVGVVVDRMSRRRLLIGVNAAAIGVVASLFAVRGEDQVWLIYPVALLYGVTMSLVAGARAGLLKDMLPAGQLADANAALQTTGMGLRLIAPLTGAALYALWGPAWVILLDLGTFAAAIGFFAAVRVTESPVEASRTGGLRTEITAGFGFVRTHPVVRQMVLAAGLAFLGLGLFESVPFALLESLGRAPSWFGALSTVQGVGVVAGGLLVARLIRRLAEPRTLGTGLLLLAVATLLLLVPSTAVVLAGAVLLGFSLPLVAVAAATALQRHTPARLLGRVFAANELVVGTAQVASVAAGAALIAVVDFRVLLVAVVVVLLPVCALLLTRPATAAGAAEQAGAGAAEQAGAGAAGEAGVAAQPVPAGPDQG